MLKKKNYQTCFSGREQKPVFKSSYERGSWFSSGPRVGGIPKF